MTWTVKSRIRYPFGDVRCYSSGCKYFRWSFDDLLLFLKLTSKCLRTLHGYSASFLLPHRYCLSRWLFLTAMILPNSGHTGKSRALLLLAGGQSIMESPEWLFPRVSPVVVNNCNSIIKKTEAKQGLSNWFNLCLASASLYVVLRPSQYG